MPKEKKPNKTLQVLITILVVVVIITLSFIFQGEKQNTPVNEKINPYIEKIVLNDLTLRTKSSNIASNCESGNKECQLNLIYRYVVDNNSYYSDPRTQELIQSPQETINIKGGDCEDLTILLISLLENLGIKTYLVLTENHAYTLACGLDLDKLQTEVLKSMNQKINWYDEIVSIPKNSAMYYGGDGSKLDSTIKINYEIDSTIPIKLEVVNSKYALEDWSNGESYKYYPSCSKESFYKWSSQCEIEKAGGILIINNNEEDAKIKLKMDIEYTNINLEDFSTEYYIIKKEKCIILESTAGKTGYPGMEVEIIGNKTAIDPLTKEEYSLE